MANIENLKPVRSEKEARELGRKGGIASGEARREKATMKKTLEMLLDTIPNIKENKDKKTFIESVSTTTPVTSFIFLITLFIYTLSFLNFC